jgi:hypothetical protein
VNVTDRPEALECIENAMRHLPEYSTVWLKLQEAHDYLEEQIDEEDEENDDRLNDRMREEGF